MDATTTAFLQPIANSTIETWQRQFMLINAIVLMLLVLLAITGNCLTLVAFLKLEKLRTSRYMLIASLAVTDALVGISVGVIAFTGMLPVWCPLTLGTILTQMAVTLPTVVSHLHILLMAVERCVAVVAPFSQWMTTKRRLSLMASVWLFGIIYSLTLLSWGWENKEGDGRCLFSPIPQIYTGTIQFLLYSLVVLAVIVIYGHIWRVAKRHKNRIGTVRHQAQSDVSSNDAQKSAGDSEPSVTGTPKATKFITAVIGAYLGTWSPYLLLGVISVIEPKVTSHEAWVVLLQISFDLMLANSCLNVFIYAVYIKDFRKAYQSLVSCRTSA